MSREWVSGNAPIDKAMMRHAQYTSARRRATGTTPRGFWKEPLDTRRSVPRVAKSPGKRTIRSGKACEK